jgi:Rrf2 family protein
MKITAQVRYALRILTDLAVRGGTAPRPIKEIATSQGISEKFISRIAVPLRRAGFVESERGAKGGLTLAKRPEKITLLDIAEALEGPLALVPCLGRPGACPRQGRCAAERAWSGVDAAFSSALRRITLADVARDERRFSPPEPPSTPAEPDYCI